MRNSAANTSSIGTMGTCGRQRSRALLDLAPKSMALAVVVLLVAALGGCGGDDGVASSATPLARTSLGAVSEWWLRFVR